MKKIILALAAVVVLCCPAVEAKDNPLSSRMGPTVKVETNTNKQKLIYHNFKDVFLVLELRAKEGTISHIGIKPFPGIKLPVDLAELAVMDVLGIQLGAPKGYETRDWHAEDGEGNKLKFRDIYMHYSDMDITYVVNKQDNSMEFIIIRFEWI